MRVSQARLIVVAALAAAGLAVAAAPTAQAAPGETPESSGTTPRTTLEQETQDALDGPHPPRWPEYVNGGAWPTSHVQGVVVDQENGFVYWSFTQMLVKTDLDGNVIGTVEGITGHLGDIDLNPRDGRVYGSLEYKAEEAFYIAIVDVARVDRIGMDAETDGVLTTVHLAEVVEDFTADMNGDGVFDGDTGDTPDHRYGCSGIDGVSFGPSFGARADSRQKLMVAYGVYANTERTDNDHQVILEYDIRDWGRYERPLSEAEPHRSGPRRVDDKYFLYTGNTTYGVQNLEYDRHTGNWLMAVYPGTKAEFPNYPLFMVDGGERPRRGEIVGQPEYERGTLLNLLPQGRYDEATDTWGWDFDGSYGLESLGDGYYYGAEGRSVPGEDRPLQEGEIHLYRWTGATPTPFDPVAESDNDA
ncbi:hypothetical protein [Streptomyces triticirhizae]|uniref:Uncharacterized protein n=1 Tax=Streptomyces triticirhizae TaxID=2483353 RepID=A0A3M2M471_9ACTN|nr:hypothetical protein [Streptomyces triticirhizae]RMI43603.1 hypothetical protein EBN88_06840 [Streptomyces triticirhizae]